MDIEKEIDLRIMQWGHRLEPGQDDLRRDARRIIEAEKERNAAWGAAREQTVQVFGRNT